MASPAGQCPMCTADLRPGGEDCLNCGLTLAAIEECYAIGVTLGSAGVSPPLIIQIVGYICREDAIRRQLAQVRAHLHDIREMLQ